MPPEMAGSPDMGVPPELAALMESGQVSDEAMLMADDILSQLGLGSQPTGMPPAEGEVML
jgi:hypothetical protein